MIVILISNYLPDQQQSMYRFAHMLHNGFADAGVESLVWYPSVVVGRLTKNTTSGLGKWLGYIDKWILSPVILRWRTRLGKWSSSAYHFHICDHSNAPYIQSLPLERTVVTCHDVLAIRGAMGYADAYTASTRAGKLLQQWILNSLRKTRKLAAVSRFTLDQLRELTGQQELLNANWRIIYNAFNAPFSPGADRQAADTLSGLGLSADRPFILHVGSSLLRKNRSMLLSMVAELGDQWTGQICFAGQPVDKSLQASAHQLGLSQRIVSVTSPDHDTLLALYRNCQAFVFPSFSEGFGWPIIEAQACGTPVITNRAEPMNEVSGGAALLADPNRPDEFAQALLKLQDDSVRNTLIQQGFANCARFSQRKMIDDYIELHRSLN